MFMSIFNLRGAQTDRFRYEVFQNLFFSSMNTGFLRDTVATVPTVYGIETLNNGATSRQLNVGVATVPTVYGIETNDFARLSLTYAVGCNSTYRLRY